MSNQTSYAREYIHIFTSKGIYETSEDFWFKGIAIDDSTMCVSDRFHTAYVEIVDPSDSVVWREKYRMSNGMCDGHVYVGDDWKPGEYRMFMHTRGSLGLGDTVVYPKRFLVVSDLPEAPAFISSAKERMQYIDIPDTLFKDRLNVTVTLDSAEYHTRSKVRATVKVTDAEGNPVRAILAMSVADALYSYPPADVDIESHTYGILHDTVNIHDRVFEPFLSDAAVSGHLRSRNKKNTMPLEGQYINVFNYNAEKGDVNIISTGRDGYFEVFPEIGSSLGKELLLKPLVDEGMKPCMELDEPFQRIDGIRKNAVERNYPLIRKNALRGTEDTVDYSGRHTVRLDELLVKGKKKYYSRKKKDKLMGYLDSIAISKGSAWVCCGEIVNGEYVGGFLNDYYPGFNHHPIDDPHYYKTPPKNISIPERGKVYKMIKMTWVESMQSYTYELESWAQYNGPHYSDEDLLAMEGICKSQGYYPKHRFKLPDEYDHMSGIEDFRNTLLWLPRAQTDDNGELTVEFPTSDIKSLFKMAGIIITEKRGIDQFWGIIDIK